MSPSGGTPSQFPSTAQSPPAVSQAPHRSRKVEWQAIAVVVFIVALYFGLVTLGQWQADEFNYFERLRHGIGQAYASRLQWSPRPLSEALYLGYGLLANCLGRPFAGGLLGLLWIEFLFCAGATALTSKSRENRLLVLLLGFGLAAAFLTSGPLFQVFYWPAGTLAYLPTLSATLLLFLQILDGQLSFSRGRTLCFVALLVAALSSEMGAMIASCCALLQSLAMLRGWDRNRREHERSAWWLVPGVVSGAVLFWLATHRLTADESAFTVSSPALHDPLRSATAAAKQLILEIAGCRNGTKRPLSAAVTVTARLALATSVALMWRTPRGESDSEPAEIRFQLLVLGASFLAACFASLFASYLHFGDAGGERYEILRRCWITMTYIALIVSLGAAPLQRWRTGVALAPFLLVAAVLLPWHVSPLLREYVAYHRVRDAVESTFQSGYRVDGERMILVLPPSGGIITPAMLAPGTYSRGSQAGGFNYAGYILAYFGKQTLVVSTEQSPTHPSTASPVP